MLCFGTTEIASSGPTSTKPASRSSSQAFSSSVLKPKTSTSTPCSELAEIGAGKTDRVRKAYYLDYDFRAFVQQILTKFHNITIESFGQLYELTPARKIFPPVLISAGDPSYQFYSAFVLFEFEALDGFSRTSTPTARTK